MGYVPPPPFIHPRLGVFPPDDEPTSPPLNLDRHGMPRDFATYMWVTYKRRVTDDSPARRAFLNGNRGVLHFDQQYSYR